MLDYRDYPELSAEFVARHPLDDPRFEPWLEAWYGLPLSKEIWQHEPEDVSFHPQNSPFATFVTRSWPMGRALTDRFGVEPVGQTIWCLSNTCLWPSEPKDGERMMWDAVDVLFREVFVPHANDTLCHLDEPHTQIGAALYMFWDFCGWWQRGDPGVGEFVNRGYPEVKSLAHAFIERGRTSRPELFEYAAKAAEGMIQ